MIGAGGGYRQLWALIAVPREAEDAPEQHVIMSLYLL